MSVPQGTQTLQNLFFSLIFCSWCKSKAGRTEVSVYMGNFWSCTFGTHHAGLYYSLRVLFFFEAYAQVAFTMSEKDKKCA